MVKKVPMHRLSLHSGSDRSPEPIGHMKTIDPVTIVIVTIYFANPPPTPASIQDFDFAGQAISRFNLEASVRRRREI